MALRIVLSVAFLSILPIAAFGEDIAPMALNSIGMVPPKIQGAPVEDSHGAVVGHVAKIETDVQGKPLRVDVTLNRGPMVFLDTACSVMTKTPISW